MDRTTSAGEVLLSTVPSRLDRLRFSPWHWRVVLCLGITWILDGLEASLVASVAGVLTRPDALGLRVSQVGLASSAYLGGEIAGALLFGRLTDQYGRKRLFLITLMVYLLGTGLSGLAVGFWSFLCFRFLAGMGLGGEYAAINSAIREIAARRLDTDVIDWNQIVIDHAADNIMSEDTVHPNAAGVALLADAYLTAIRRC
mgnify:CR=1 FL=1